MDGATGLHRQTFISNHWNVTQITVKHSKLLQAEATDQHVLVTNESRRTVLVG